MKLDYSSEKLEHWITIQSKEIRRKLENETAFDGIIKIYSLKTNETDLNKNLFGMYFGDFIYESDCGIFLRMFNNKNSWPKTTLIHVNFQTHKITEIIKTNSSWNIWNGFDLGNGNYQIEISPNEKVPFKTS